MLCVLALHCVGAARADAIGDWFVSLDQIPPETALQMLDEAPASYRQRGDYYYWLGVYTEKAGLPTAQAIAHFEHALMLDPNHAGAWYDYGLALCRIGDQASCQNVLETARARFGAPPALGEAADRPMFALAGELRSNVGYSNNLNFGSGVESINLSLDGQDISLDLAATSRAQAAWFGDAALDVTLIPTDAPQLTATFTAYERLPLQNRELIGNYRVLVGDLIYAFTPSQRGGLQTYGIDDSNLGSLNVFGGWWQMQHEGLEASTLLGAERRNPSGSLASYTTLRAEYVARIWRSLEGRLGAEDDLPAGDRPGYSQRRWTVGLRLPLQIMERGQLEIGARWQDAQDTQAYSPLFGDVVRRITTREGRLRLSWPLAPRVDLRFDARYARQISNIDLFDLNEKYFTLGFAARF